MDMSLSLRMMSRSLGVDDTLLSPSKASPPLMAPSPITATTCLGPLLPDAAGQSPARPSRCAATAMPKAAEMELEAWPQVNVSYSLSMGVGKGQMPCSLRLVQNCSRRPVSILCP